MKILLVDDEKLLLDSLEASINWDDYGLKVVGKACNGVQARIRKVLVYRQSSIVFQVRKNH